MPTVDLKEPRPLDLIHARRMLDAYSKLIGELMLLGNGTVNHFLECYSVVLLPGPRAAIDYPFGSNQILEKELAEANMPVKKAKKKK